MRIVDPSPLLKPDMLARVRLMAAPNDANDEAAAPLRTVTRVFAPADAIHDGIAWVVAHRDGDAGVAERRRLDLGDHRHEGWVEIRDGLRPGDLVIVGGEPQEGRPIRVRDAGTPTTGGADA